MEFKIILKGKIDMENFEDKFCYVRNIERPLDKFSKLVISKVKLAETRTFYEVPVEVASKLFYYSNIPVEYW